MSAMMNLINPGISNKDICKVLNRDIIAYNKLVSAK